MYYPRITDEEFEAYRSYAARHQVINHQLRAADETLYSELKAGASAFDEEFGEVFTRMVVTN